MREFINKQNTTAEFYTSEKCYITELSNTPDDLDVSIAQARVEPGVTTCWHRLIGIVERYYIIKGKGLMEVGDLPPQEVEVGDVVVIPAMCRQRIKNIGQDDLVFLAICTPRFTGDAYENVEILPVQG
ncbi:MAG: cupin domain-containing protein [Pseudomonadota bacterium]|nr:cupin domain-containing protein [Pseudomonadota bacterium]